MNLYIAINSETDEPKIFTGYEDLKEFAMENKYGYNYYKLGEAEVLSDSELGYWN